jgi:hypothetical protein
MLGLSCTKLRVILSMLSISIFFWGCAQKGDETLPPDLVGVWKSSAPRFKYDTLQLSKEYIVFTSGEFQDFINVNFIQKVERKPERNHVFYVIHYENIHEQEYKFSFYYYPTKGGVIRLKNQMDSEWKKVKSVAGRKRPPTFN